MDLPTQLGRRVKAAIIYDIHPKPNNVSAHRETTEARNGIIPSMETQQVSKLPEVEAILWTKHPESDMSFGVSTIDVWLIVQGT